MKRERSKLKSRLGSAENLPFHDSFFDRAYSTMALHHFSDLGKALGEFARILKPCGYL